MFGACIGQEVRCGLCLTAAHTTTARHAGNKGNVNYGMDSAHGCNAANVAEIMETAK